MQIKARPSGKRGLLPLPKGEGWGEELQTIERSNPLTPSLSPMGRGSPAGPCLKSALTRKLGVESTWGCL
jgi:hypothetical protein